MNEEKGYKIKFKGAAGQVFNIGERSYPAGIVRVAPREDIKIIMASGRSDLFEFLDSPEILPTPAVEISGEPKVKDLKKGQKKSEKNKPGKEA